jgi:carbon-monoxide dehydrogenase medium subunit
MTYWRTYVTPRTLDEALAALRRSSGAARVVAGGTDLLLDLRQGRHAPVDTLVDVTRLQELLEIRIEAQMLFLGAAVTHAVLAADSRLAQHARSLGEACALIGGPQVRNVATLGGNVAHALPAADATIALLALGAQAELASVIGGRQTVPLGSLFAAPGLTSFDRAGTIIVGFHLPLRRGRQGSAFRRVMRPQGVAIAILNLAVWVELDEQAMIADARVAAGPSAPTPQRLRAAEKALIGQPASDIDYAAVSDGMRAESRLRSSAHRATADYRRHLLGVLLERTLPAALEDARRPSEAGA